MTFLRLLAACGGCRPRSSVVAAFDDALTSAWLPLLDDDGVAP